MLDYGDGRSFSKVSGNRERVLHRFAAALPQLPLNQESKTLCPYCKVEHTWRVREARWVDAIPPEIWIENR